MCNCNTVTFVPFHLFPLTPLPLMSSPLTLPPLYTLRICFHAWQELCIVVPISMFFFVLFELAGGLNFILLCVSSWSVVLDAALLS